MLVMKSFAPILFRQSPFVLKRCLRSQKKLKLLIQCIERTAHAVKSHLLSQNSLLNLSAPLPVGGRGPLINTSAFTELTVSRRLSKCSFNFSDCCFSMSLEPMCRIKFFTVGCSATISKILSSKSDTISSGKQSTLVSLLLFISFTEKSPTIRFSGPVVSFLCGFKLAGLTLLRGGGGLSRNLEGDPWSCNSGANLFCRFTPVCWGGFLVVPLFSVVRCFVLRSTGVEEALCLDGNAGQSARSQISGRRVLPVIRSPLSGLLFGFAPSVVQGGLSLVDLLPCTESSSFFIVPSLLVSWVLACSCPLF